MNRRRFVVVGDALLDRDVEGDVRRISPDAPVPVLDESTVTVRPGGAALAALLAARDGHEVTLVTALGDGPAGTEVRRLLVGAGVDVVAARLEGPTPEKIRFRAGNHPLLRLDRGGSPRPPGPLPAGASALIEVAGVVLVSDYGRGVAAHDDVRRALGRRRQPTVWDPHPRGPDPVPGLTVSTPNRSELEQAVPVLDGPPFDDPLQAILTRTRAARIRWNVQAVATTLGEDGALLVAGDGPPLVVPGIPAVGDPCGAGDRFAVAVGSALLGGALLSEAVTAAVRAAGAFVAAGGAPSVSLAADDTGPAPVAAGDLPGPAPVIAVGGGQSDGTARDDASRLAATVRNRGGRVVVAGGCFDLLHAGHVSLLQAARRLGDCLIVAINSDHSVRRLKGPGRPIVGEADRVAMLQALSCVDGVAVFDDDTPIQILTMLRPHLFAKGGDYSNRRLPEEDILAEWGGQVVVVPYLSGRSTSGLLGLATTGR
jgi:D-beta-D-heptose 7-phosphate kinase/D-beta-D-heptose 1-phosphate adenosyltransferase